MKVTICIPTFNSEKTIEETLNSICNQTYKNITVKVFDNASSDNTVEIVTGFKIKLPSLEIFTNEVNIGAEGNFTRCINAAEGDYTAIFHADDIYLPEMIEEQVRAFKQEGIIAVCTQALEINLKGEILGKRFIPKEVFKQNVINKKSLYELVSLYGNFITCPSVMMDSKVLKEEIKIWNGEKFKTSADLDIWLRVSEFGKIKFLTRPLMKYRVDNVSTSFNLKKIRLHEHDIFKVFVAHEGFKTDEYLKNIEFLKFKDQSLRMLNSIKVNKGFNPSVINHKRVTSKVIHSFWHIKYFIAAMLIRIIYNIRKAFKFNR